MIASIVSKHLLQHTSVLEPPIHSLLLTTQHTMYLLPRHMIRHTHWTLYIVRSLSDIPIIRLNSFTRTKQRNQWISKNSDVAILSSWEGIINPNNITSDYVQRYLVPKRWLLVLVGEELSSILEDLKIRPINRYQTIIPYVIFQHIVEQNLREEK